MSTESSTEIEIYPMPSFPTLVVSDIQASTLWYCEVLGFTHIFTMPGPNGVPAMVHLRWIKYADLLLFPDWDNSLANKPKGVGVALNYSTGDIEHLAKRARQHKANIVEGPVNRPWNICELVILDPDGYRLVFNGPLLAGEHRSFDEIVASASKGFKN
jgi:catechol 2,3-dioxygenase-like lactoylglutathione lyase family enzyme